MANENVSMNPPRARRRVGAWLRVLLVGLAIFLVGVLLLTLTRNPNLFPTVVMVGSFMVPVAYVAFFYERRHLSQLTMPVTAFTLLYGGLLGVLAASLLEPIFVSGPSFGNAFLVGLIEEFAKILGVLLLVRGHRHDAELDGLILGAAAGMGFAAFESLGYAFTAFVQSRGSISAAVGVTLFRGLLSPVGHGTWTAILTGVLFRESRPGRFHLTWAVLVAYLTVAALHGLWDGLPLLLSMLPLPGLASMVAAFIVGSVGLAILWFRWREARRLQVQRSAQGEAE